MDKTMVKPWFLTLFFAGFLMKSQSFTLFSIKGEGKFDLLSEKKSRGFVDASVYNFSGNHFSER